MACRSATKHNFTLNTRPADAWRKALWALFQGVTINDNAVTLPTHLDQLSSRGLVSSQIKPWTFLTTLTFLVEV